MIDKTLIKFLITGITSTAIHIICALAIYHLIITNLIIASLLGFFIALIFSYLSHTYWSFKNKPSVKNCTKFLTVNIALIAVNIGLVKLSNIYYFSEDLSIVTIACSLAIISFVLHKYWTYRVN